MLVCSQAAHLRLLCQSVIEIVVSIINITDRGLDRFQLQTYAQLASIKVTALDIHTKRLLNLTYAERINVNQYSCCRRRCSHRHRPMFDVTKIANWFEEVRKLAELAAFAQTTTLSVLGRTQ
jgi:hypothetical protein